MADGVRFLVCASDVEMSFIKSLAHFMTNKTNFRGIVGVVDFFSISGEKITEIVF